MVSIKSYNCIKKTSYTQINNKHSLLWFGLLIILCLHGVWFLLGESSYVTIFDNLDGELIYFKLLIESGDAIGFNPESLIHGTMNGIERSFFRSGLNLSFLFFKYFKPINAYILNHLFTHIIGFIGMYLLVNRYFSNSKVLSFFVATCFAFLSYYHIQYGISISGQPILLFSFLNFLRSNYKWYDWFIIILFPFYAFSPVTVPFFVPVLSVMGLWDFFQTKKINHAFILGIILFAVFSLLVDFPLLYNTFISENISHRTEFDLPRLHGYQFNKSILNFFNKLYQGETHVHTGKLPSNPILFCLLVLYIFKRKVNKMVFFFIAINMAILLFDSFYNLFVKISPMPNLTLSRMFFLSPLIWLIILICILREFDLKNNVQRIFLAIFMVFFLKGVVDNNNEIKYNFKIIKHQKPPEPTFQEYFDQEIFGQIKSLLGKKNIDKKNFICVGLHPNVAQYNGLKTLDSYQNNYSLAYKHEFRRIISKELERDSIIKSYFDNWGSRCYAFSSEIGQFRLNNLSYTDLLYNKHSNLRISKLDYNWQAFLDMNGKYVLSSLPIHFNVSEPVKLLNTFVSKQSYRKLYLYEVNISG